MRCNLILHVVAATAAVEEVDQYRLRLTELDNAIAELLEGDPVRDTESLRRSESDRRGSEEGASGASASSRPIRRTRSERKGGSSRQSRNL